MRENNSVFPRAHRKGRHKMLKRSLKTIISFVLSAAVMLPTGVFSAWEGAVTVSPSLYDAYNPGALEKIIRPASVVADCTVTADSQTGETVIRIDKGTNTANTNQDVGTMDLSGMVWKNTGYIEITYDVETELDEAYVSGDLFQTGLTPRFADTSGRVAWNLNKAPHELFPYRTYGGKLTNVKYLMHVCGKDTTITVLAKDSTETDYTQLGIIGVRTDTSVSNTDFTLKELRPYSRVRGASTVRGTIKYSNVTVREMYDKPQLHKGFSGTSYVPTAASKLDISYYLPREYKEGRLTFGGETVKEFDPALDFGGYTTTLSLENAAVADGTQIILYVVNADETVTEESFAVDIIEPITVPLLSDISGTYLRNQQISIDYEIPHEYQSAVLSYNGDVVKSYTSGEKTGGRYNTLLNLSDYDYTGENLPIELKVTYNGREDDVIERLITVNEFFDTPYLSDISGIYVCADSVVLQLILPDDYESAYLSLNGNTVKSYNAAENKSGRYTQSVPLSAANITGSDAALALKIRYKDSSKADDELIRMLYIYDAVNISVFADEGFENEETAVTVPGEIEVINGMADTGRDSAVAMYESKTTAWQRTTINKQNTSFSNDSFIDIEYDAYVTNYAAGTGILLKNTAGSFYSGTPAWLQTGGKFLDSSEHTYTTNKWYTIKYRIIPGKYRSDGKGIICLYVDGSYVGFKQIAVDNGLGQLGIDLFNGYATGKVYIDNVKMTSFAPKYTTSVKPIDKDGNYIDAIDCINPGIELTFNQKMKAETLTPSNVSFKSFSGAEIKCDISYISETGKLYIKPLSRLAEGKEYSICIGENVQSNIGTSYKGGLNITLMSKAASVHIASADVQNLSSLSANTEFDVSVTMENNSAAVAKGNIFAAFYCGGRLMCLTSTPVNTSTASTPYSLTLKTPAEMTGERKVIVYYTAGINDYSILDIKEIY